MDIQTLLTNLGTNGRTWDQMRRDGKEAAAVIRLLLQQNAELALASKGLLDAAMEMPVKAPE